MTPAEDERPSRRRADGRPARDLAPLAAPASADPDPSGVFVAVDEALAAAHRWRRPLSIAAIETAAGAGAQSLVVGLGVVLRSTDVIWRDRANGAIVLLTDTDASGAGRALERVADAVPAARRGGIVTAAPGIAAPELLALARDRMAPLGERATEEEENA